jgi:preprotein translocase subunit SecB
MSVALKFMNYEILKLDFVKHIEPAGDGSVQVLYKVFPRNAQMSEVYAVEGIRIEATDKCPYDIECVISGHFKVQSGSKKEDVLKMFKVNTAAILFPYIRALISFVTSQNPTTRIILPPININALMKDKKDEEIFEERNYEDFIAAL